MVEATINYLAPIPERPYFFLYPPPEGTPFRNTKGDRQTVAIDDGRDLDPSPSLDVEGVVLVPYAPAFDRFDDDRAIRSELYTEVERLVAAHTGSARVFAFDHNLRSSSTEDYGEKKKLQAPVLFPHNDYTESSGPQRVRDLLAGEAEAILQKRFAVINVWKPINRPVEDAPLAVCDARTIQPDDLVETDLRYRDRTGEIYSLRFRPEQRWIYFSKMRPDEAMLLKCYDSARDVARFTAHSAFEDPTARPDAPHRESIEIRTLAFY